MGNIFCLHKERAANECVESFEVCDEFLSYQLLPLKKGVADRV